MTSSSSNDVQRLSCHLGIDVGTQGLTALLATDEAVASTDATANTSSKSFRMKVLAIGEASYGFVPGLAKDCYEQNPQDWEDALLKALKQIQTKLVEKKLSVTVRALCVTGQMHGCVMLDCNGNALGTARLWCDARNQSEEAKSLRELGLGCAEGRDARPLSLDSIQQFHGVRRAALEPLRHASNQS